MISSELGPLWAWSLTPLLLNTALHSTVLLGLMGLVTWALRRHSPAIRYALWRGALAGCLVLPLLSSFSPVRPLVSFPWPASPPPAARPAVEQPVAVPVASPAAPLPAAPRGDTTEAAAPTPSRGRAGGGWGWIPGLWGLGVILGVGLHLVRVGSLRRLRRRARPVRDPVLRALALRLAREVDLRRPVELRLAEGLRGPVAGGLRRPAILLPVGMETFPPAQLELILLHELAHLRRGDPLALWVEEWVRCLFFFQPLAWLATRRLAEEREVLVDAQVLAWRGDRRAYARLLTEAAVGPPPGWLAAAFGLFQSHLARRVQQIVGLAQGPSPRLTVRGRLTVGLLLGLCLVAAGLFRLVGEDAPEPWPWPGEETVSVSGRVKLGDGSPLPGAHVEAWWVGSRGQVVIKKTCDAEGRFLFPALPTRHGATLAAWHPRYGLVRMMLMGRQASPQSGWPVLNRDLTDVDLQIGPLPFATGRLTDEQGRPLGQVMVRAAVLDWPGEVPRALQALWTTRTNAEGYFGLSCLPAFLVHLRLESEERFAVPPVLSSTPALLCCPDLGTVPVSPAASIVGRVTWPNGRPASGVTVGAMPMPLSSGGSGGRATTDWLGRYRLTRLKAGEYTVQPSSNHNDNWKRKWAEGQRRIVRVQAGEVRSRVNFVLTRGGVVSGRVLDPHGQPFGGMPLALYDAQDPHRCVGYTQTNAEGRYCFRVVPGDWEVQLLGEWPVPGWRCPAEKTQRITVHDGKETKVSDFHLELDQPRPQPTALRVRVVDPAGKPVPQATVYFSYPGIAGRRDIWDRLGETTDEQEVLELRCSWPATLLARVWKPDLATPKPVTVDPTRTKEVTLRLRPRVWWTLRGRVLSEDGEPLSDASIYASGAPSGSRPEINARGEFVVSGLWPNCRYRVSVEAKDHGRVRREAQGGVRETVDLGAVRLPRAAAFIAGRVVYVDGRPAPNMRVWTQAGTYFSFNEARTDRNGRFRLGPFVPGMITVTADDAYHLMFPLRNGMGAEAASRQSDTKTAPAGTEDVVLVLRPWR